MPKGKKDSWKYCPYSGKTINIVKVGDLFMACSPHGWNSSPMLSEKEVEMWLRWKNGVSPYPKITITERVGPAKGEAIEIAKEAGRVIE